MEGKGCNGDVDTFVNKIGALVDVLVGDVGDADTIIGNDVGSLLDIDWFRSIGLSDDVAIFTAELQNKMIIFRQVKHSDTTVN